MKTKMIVIHIITTLFLSWTTYTQADGFDKASYVESVINILRTHADAIANLSTHKMKYSDNLVRHAIAMQKTFGLLGPMDWHAANSATLANRNSEMDTEKFEQLEKDSRSALKGLVIAAHDAMVEDNRQGIKEALDNVKESCNACHAYLPASVAPDVWGTLKRK